MSVSELLEVIATTPRHFYLPGTNLSSYSLSASQYLEAVPSCESLRARLTVASDTKTNAFVTAFESDGDVLATHLAIADVGATAAQSATNVWMMRVVADLRASQGDVAAAAALHGVDRLAPQIAAAPAHQHAGHGGDACDWVSSPAVHCRIACAGAAQQRIPPLRFRRAACEWSRLPGLLRGWVPPRRVFKSVDRGRCSPVWPFYPAGSFRPQRPQPARPASSHALAQATASSHALVQATRSK